MIVKELLPILPKEHNNGDTFYDVKVNYKQIISINNNLVKGEKKKVKRVLCYEDILLGRVFKEKPQLLECEVEEITSGKLMVGGSFDKTLQIWLKTEEFAEIRDYTK